MKVCAERDWRASRRAALAWPLALGAAVRAASAAEVRVLVGGDVILARAVARRARAAGDPVLPWRGVAQAFRDADIAFVNLESPFTDKARSTSGNMVFRAAPEMLAGLEHAGIDVVSTANNHARDAGAYGVTYTLELLDQAGIGAAGTGHTRAQAHAGVVLERRGTLIGFLGYTYDQANGNWTSRDERICGLDARQAALDIRSMRDRADVVIVSMHAGVEYGKRPHPTQVAFARAAIDAGGAAVIGHHPHVVQPWEIYNGGLILYSLGNLIFDQDRKETKRGLLAELYFRGHALARARLIPVDLVDTAPRIAGPGEWILGGAPPASESKAAPLTSAPTGQE